MWSPQICLFLVVTPLMVCAAPAAPKAPATQNVENESIQQHLVNVESVDLTVKRSAIVDSLDSTVKRSARIDSFLAIPSTGFTCSEQAVPGIYADQETGCQVFHYCHGGRMDSFFCPNLTLFNQQYFVCDWSYNVDCNSAHQYFSLNEALYKTPEKIYQAINPAIKIVQNEFLQGAASSEVSRTLNSHFSQLDSRSSAIVVDSAPSPTLLVQPTNKKLFPEAKSDRESKSLNSEKDSNLVDSERNGKSFDSSLGSNGNTVIPSYGNTVIPSYGNTVIPSYGNTVIPSYGNTVIPSNDQITTIVVTQPTPITTVTVSPVIKDVPTASIVNAEQSSYYDDSADPEPTDILGSYSSYGSSASYDSVTETDTYTGDTSYTDAADNAYDDAVADPEPAGYYSGNSAAAGASSAGYNVIDNSNYDSSAAYDSVIATDTYPADTSYTDAADNAYDDAVADPEPAGYYSGNSAAAGASSAGYNGIDNSNYGSQSQGSVPSYGDAVSNVYDPYDSADPEPSAIPYSSSGSYGQYDSADPEPDSFYGYYDSADPEPASYYGANTIDLSASPQVSYQPSSASQYSNTDPATSLTFDYDDASADPEPDPSSYRSDINVYDDSSAPVYQQPSYKSYTPSNAINDYYKGYPSQGLVVDSPDPEPSADPEFTPYGE